ncbi:MAG: hypothetical protein HS132_05685 [Planctomycetia bacterium]|nr:hypothetical protein [Planctomycetia bacterium]
MPDKHKIPPAFSIVKKGDTTLFVKDVYKEIILRMVFDKEFFQNRNSDTTNMKTGRSSYLSIPATENSKERFIIRNYKHGGLFGNFFGGVFCNENRPLHEISINEIASQKGVPSAEVVAVTKRRWLGLFYTADFISKEIPCAVDVLQFLKESPPEVIQVSKKAVIHAVVTLIRIMHDAGIYHADLHLKNILLKRASNGGFHAYIIDLDKSVVLKKLTIDQRIKNLLRLDRSIVKLRCLSSTTNPSQKKPGLISKADRIRFFKSYMLYGNVLDKNWKMYVRQYYTHHVLHKLWWRILGLS